MIKIRFGEFTIYEGIEMSVRQYYGHGLDQETEFNHRILSYPAEYGVLEGFSLDADENVYKRDILLKDINNSFYVITKAIYKNITFTVDSSSITEFVTLKLKSADDLQKLGLTEYLVGDELKMSENDLYLTKYFAVHNGYIIQCKSTLIEKMWEERMPYLDFPYPEGLPTKKVIDISR